MQNNNHDMNNNEAKPFISFEKAWAGLKPELDAEAARREKRKRRIIFFWFTSIVIGLGIGVYVFENNKIKSNYIVQKNAAISNTEDKEVSTINKEFNTKEPTKAESRKNNEMTFTSEVKPSSNVVIESSQVNTKLQNARVFKTKIAAASIKNSIAEKDVISNVAHHSIKTKSQGAKTIIQTSDNGLKYSKASQQKSKESTLEVVTDVTDNLEKDITQTNLSNSIVAATGSIDSTKKLVDTTAVKSSIANTSTNKTNKAEGKKSNAFHYGLQWNLPAQVGVNFLDVNSVNQPATLLIPQLFVSKQLGKKHSLILAFNPYAQYYLNNKAVVDFNKYDVVIYSASQSNTIKPEEITYTEATAFNKLISIEASLLYQYQISSKVKIGFGISNSWVQAALMQNKVVKNASLITRDSLYGIDKTDKDWSHLKTSFLLGKLELQYNIKKLDIGICFSKPISSPFDISQYKTPINTNLFVRWMIK
ncbi:MAG: hypothetical protein ACOVO1_01570 [Chitinophagaceae bacterium]